MSARPAPGRGIQLSAPAVQAFAQASHDRNPLHLSAAYARRTAYGEPVVFGVLGTLAVLARLEPPADTLLARLTADFVNPLYADVPYALEVERRGEAAFKVRVSDGARTVLRLKAEYAAPRRAAAPPLDEPAAARAEARDLSPHDLAETRVFRGTYEPEASALASLRGLLDLDRAGIAPADLSALLASSYVAGMEMPGLRSLIGRIDLELGRVPEAAGRLAWEATSEPLDPRFSRLPLHLRFACGSLALARGTVTAFVRLDLPPPEADPVGGWLEPSRRLEGRTALVTGASRGLGACLAEALLGQGARVLGTFASSTEEARRLQDRLGPRGRFELLQGDGGDPAFWEQARLRVRESGGGLDLLVCNAAPPLRALSTTPAMLPHIHDYVTRSLALVDQPLAAFLPDLVEREGRAVLISSTAVEEPLTDWPHYVVAKAAGEALLRTVAAAHPSLRALIARPPRILTALSNTPAGRLDARPPAPVAARIVREVLDASRAPGLSLLTDFGEARGSEASSASGLAAHG